MLFFRQSYVAIFISESSGLRHVAGYQSNLPATLNYTLSYAECNGRSVAALTIPFNFLDFEWPVHCHVYPGGFIRRHDHECLVIRWKNDGGRLIRLRDCKFRRKNNFCITIAFTNSFVSSVCFLDLLDVDLPPLFDDEFWRLTVGEMETMLYLTHMAVRRMANRPPVTP